jgi:hypothetical protein
LRLVHCSWFKCCRNDVAGKQEETEAIDMDLTVRILERENYETFSTVLHELADPELIK